MLLDTERMSRNYYWNNVVHWFIDIDRRAQVEIDIIIRTCFSSCLRENLLTWVFHVKTNIYIGVLHFKCMLGRAKYSYLVPAGQFIEIHCFMKHLHNYIL